jgi:peptidyl-prolyl cis-trans isomerase A (cyclophilin A)
MKRFVAGVLGLCLAASIAVAADEAGKGGSPLMNPNSPEMNQKAPATFKVKFTTSKGDFTVDVHKDWSPTGADRFYNLVKNGWFTDVRFFRVVENFMVQFGISGDPKLNNLWREARIQDDPAKPGIGNKRGYMTYAKTGQPNSRTTQMFINFKDNAFLDSQGFTPFGMVDEAGMKVIDALYNGYGEGAPRGQGPDQMRIQSEGNAYLAKDFPKMDFIKKAEILP